MMRFEASPGVEVAGYRIVSEVGRGGTATVWLADHPGLGRRVALKILASDLAEDEAFRVRFTQEARIAAALEHPNVLPVYDAGEWEGLLFIAMRYVDGTDLATVLRREGPIDLDRAVPILAQVAAALDAAHAHGLVHRDVKPQNVLIDPRSGPGGQDHAYLADFGLARPSLGISGLTRAGELYGTVDYMAPEQLAGGVVDARSDVYAFSCLAYECLTGTPPFRRETILATAAAHLHEEHVPPSELQPTLPNGIDLVLAKGLAKDKSERHRSTRAVVEGLGPPQPATRTLSHHDAGPGVDQAPSDEERRIVTVLFVQIAASSHPRTDPEDIAHAAKRVHTVIEEEVERLGGVVATHGGDASVALFGTPRAHEDDAERAVRAALRIRDRSDPDVATASLRIGIETGQAIVRSSTSRISIEDFTGAVIGTASSIGRALPPGAIVVGPETYARTENAVEYSTGEPVDAGGVSTSTWVATGLRARTGFDLGAPQTTFVGRGSQLELLTRTFDRAASEPSVQLVTLVGEPGIGKSRLVRELGGVLDERADLTTWRQGRCPSFGEDITFWALGEIVKADAGILESDDPSAAAQKLKRAIENNVGGSTEREWLMRTLGSLVGIPSESPSSDQQETFAGWRRFLLAMALRGPTVLVFEDLHWADTAMLGFLEQLLGDPEPLPLLVVCTARPELFERSPAWGGGKRNSITVTLSPLSEDETGEILLGMLDGAAIPGQLRSLVERADGNPLFAEELGRMLHDRDVAGAEPGAGGTLEEIAVPASVQALIASRLDALPSEARSLILDAAVVGGTFWAGALASMAGRSDTDTDTDTALRELVRRELIREVRPSRVEGTAEFVFWHDLIREVAYGTITRPQRMRRHRAAATWLENVAGERVVDHAEVLAYHYEQVVDLAKRVGEEAELGLFRSQAARFLALAGMRALALDVSRSARFFDRALELIPEDAPERHQLLENRAAAAKEEGRYRDTERDLETAIDGYRRAGDLVGAARAMTALSQVLWDTGEVGRSRDMTREAVRILEQGQPTAELLEAYNNLSYDLTVSGESKDGFETADRVITLARQLGHETLLQGGLSRRGIARCELGDAAGVEDLHAALQLALDLGLGRQTAAAYANLANAVAGSTGAAQNLALLEEGSTFAASRGMAEMAAIIRGETFTPLWDLGRWDEALAAADATVNWAHSTGAEYWALLSQQRQALVLIARGSLDEAGGILEGGLRAAESMDTGDVLGSALQANALLAEARGQLDRAAELVERFDVTTSEGSAHLRQSALLDMARIAVHAKADDLAERLLVGCASASNVDEISLRTVSAMLKEFRQDEDGAFSEYRDLADSWADFSVLERGLCLFGAGRCASRSRVANAGELLAAGRDLFKTLGAVRLVSEVDSWLGSGNGSSGAGPAPHP